ncbi:hypothetical protein D3C73_1377870 [compost metagenome]
MVLKAACSMGRLTAWLLVAAPWRRKSLLFHSVMTIFSVGLLTSVEASAIPMQ